MTVRGWVLYEDSRTAAGEFTLHRLVMRRVHDLMAPEVEFRLLVERFQALPCRGRDKVVAAIQRDGERLRSKGAVLIAALDGDRIHDMTKLPRLGCVGPHVAAVGNMLPPMLQTRVVLLRQNVETLIETLRAGPVLSEVGEATFERALAKDRTARDGVFAAASRERCRGAREHLAAEVPDFAYLTERILQVVHETTSDGR